MNYYHKLTKDCYYFDGNELFISESTSLNHFASKLGHYKDQLITVGGNDNAETEILTLQAEKMTWKFGGGRNVSTGDITSNFILSPKNIINRYSMVNIPKSISSEEFLLLLGQSFFV